VAKNFRDFQSAIVAIAVRQHRCLTRAQLLALGVGSHAIAYWVRTGHLHRVHQGVYCVGTPPTTPLERAAAAVLACGSGAALSHGSALTLWVFQKRWDQPLHVTVPGDRRRPGIIVHQVPKLTRADLRTHLGIRVTSPARTVLDCAPDLSAKRLVRIANDGRRSGLLRLPALTDVIQRFPLHPGCARLKPLLERPSGPTRSEFEDAFLPFCDRFGLPRPQVNVKINGYEVDAFFEAEGVIVELDSWGFHQDRDSFENDRNRDVDNLVTGLVTYRLTWDRMIGDPEHEARRLGKVLKDRSERQVPSGRT
jgi:Transcriptional regulator, AbiEi antitoxin